MKAFYTEACLIIGGPLSGETVTKARRKRDRFLEKK
jgi:hypothetical protein